MSGGSSVTSSVWTMVLLISARADRAGPRSASDADQGDPASGAVAGAVGRAVSGADRPGLHHVLHHALARWFGKGEMASGECGVTDSGARA